MSEGYIGVVSLTYAYRAKGILADSGIRSTIVNTPKRGRGSRGCGYSLRVDGNIQNARSILLRNGIEVVN